MAERSIVPLQPVINPRARPGQGRAVVGDEVVQRAAELAEQLEESAVAHLPGDVTERVAVVVGLRPGCLDPDRIVAGLGVPDLFPGVAGDGFRSGRPVQPR
jgi:hypothetical protein